MRDTDTEEDEDVDRGVDTVSVPEICVGHSRPTVRFSHLLQRLFIRFDRGLLCRPVMLLLRDARPDISIMGSSGTSLADRSAVAHGVT